MEQITRTLVIDTPIQVGKRVKIQGWIHTRRDHGKIVFLDIRDRSGVVQCVLATDSRNHPGTAHLDSGNLHGESTSGVDKSDKITPGVRSVRPEDVVEVLGVVKNRPDAMVNDKISTGKVEVEVQQLTVITRAHELPFPLDTDGYEINEETRLKYRYLDLRRPRMAANIRLKSKLVTFIRNYLSARDFVEIETPMLTKTTPEGARDFLVPSRLQKGKFYALPQSPQQYKQLLMVAGFERYFQLARCFRDEDPRHDRAYGEFTQLDMELSFVTQEDILTLIEDMFTAVVKEIFPHKHILHTPWPRIPHREAIAKYGTDKPDLRKNKNDPDELAFAWTIDFPLFTEQSAEDFFHGSGGAKFAPSHHMFTSPHPDDIPLLDTNPLKVRGLQHDLVLNGYEVGGGSIRIHDPKVQDKIFDLIGFSEKQKAEFAHMLTAFTYGVPPHGGIAPGIDRFLMTVLGEPSLREVIPFPANSSGKTSVMNAPSEAGAEQLRELGISIITINTGGEGVYEEILQLLKEAKIDFHAFEHAKVVTSEEAAKVRGTELAEGAKALLLFADNKPIMITVAGDRKLDMKVFKSLYGVKDLHMASPEEVVTVTRTQIGAVPPFGSIFGIPLYMDESIRKNKFVTFNAGLHTKSIRMSEKYFEKVSQPIVGNFSK